MQEEWRQIPGYINYEISSEGEVKRLSHKSDKGARFKEKDLCQSVDRDGYLRVALKGKSFGVHQLIAMAFLNHRPCGNQIVVDHIDNNRKNNSLKNLQLISAQENSSKDRINKTGLLGVYKNHNGWMAKYNNTYLGTFATKEEASQIYINHKNQKV